jgi:hypothetical protein
MDPNPSSNGEVKRPGISSEFLRKHNIRHVGGEESSKLIGYPAPGILIPYTTLEGVPLIINGRPFCRIRLDIPTNAKYLSPKGSGAQLFIPQGQTFGEKLIIAESEFKAAALAEAGVPTVGIGGICSAMTGGKLIPELERLIAKHPPKRIFFLGDADTALIYDFAREALKLAQCLQSSIPVQAPRIPVNEPNGIDDCREKFGADFLSFWEKLIASAILIDPKTTTSIVAVTLVASELERIAEMSEQALYLEKIAVLGSRIEDPICFDRLATAVKSILDISIPTFKKAARNAAEKRREKAETEQAAHDPLHAELVAKCGYPFIGKTGVNQSYFVQRFAREHRILFEQEERAFFEYRARTGAWHQIDKDVVKELIRSDWERLVPKHKKHLADDALLTSLTNGVRSFVGRSGVFQRLPFGMMHLKNGMLKINSDGKCELLAFDPEFYSRNPLPFAFNPKATAPRFLAMICYPLDQDDADLLMRIFGSCLLEGNPAQRFFILEGVPHSAKTTIANIITGLIGRENAGELLTHLLDERFEIGRLVGKTLLTARDVAGNFLQHRSAYVLKKLVGHDYLDGEIKGSMKSLKITGDYSVLITSNETLFVWLRGETDTLAWRRRMILLAFTQSVKPQDRIHNLYKILLAEEGEGILLLAIQGAIRHLQELEKGGDFVLTNTQQGRVDKLLSESQSVRFFVMECIVADPDSDLATDEIVSAYNDYCKLKQWKAQPGKIVERQLPDLMLEIHAAQYNKHLSRGNSRTVRGYSTVALKPSTTPNSGPKEVPEGEKP